MRVAIRRDIRIGRGARSPGTEHQVLALASKFLLAAPFRSAIREPDLDSSFGETDFVGEFLASKHIRIVGAFEFWRSKRRKKVFF